jgi:UDP-glucose 4-epimerase
MAHKILITGSSGYIGSHFVKYFKKQGAEVFGIDLMFPPKTLQKYFSGHIVDDIASTEHVSQFLAKNKPDLVIHCAAKCLVAESVEKPGLYHEYNVKKAESFLGNCITHGVTKFLFSSTAATYGNPLHSPMMENHPQNPINPYGQTKLEFEKILLSKKSVTSGIFRYFNVAGADPDSEIGECHEPETHLIPNLLRAASANEAAKIFGNDYATSDGTCVRDYIHVMDLAQAHWLLATRMIEKNQGGIFNLGTTTGHSILEVLKATENVLKKSINREFHPRRAGDPPTLVADSTAAQNELGWKISYPLEQIIETAHRWHQSQD